MFYHKYVLDFFTLPLYTDTRNVTKAVWFRLQLQTLIQKLNRRKPKIELLFGLDLSPEVETRLLSSRFGVCIQ